LYYVQVPARPVYGPSIQEDVITQKYPLFYFAPLMLDTLKK
jgi:hypothetical protein